MAWWRQETSHYLNQCWPSPRLPYGITRPQNELNIYLSANRNWNKKKMVTKVTTASSYPCNGRLCWLVWVDFCSKFSCLNCVFFLDYTALYNSSRGGCKEFYSHLYALSFQLIYVLLFGHHIPYCSKLVLISINQISSNIFLFCILVLYQNWRVVF